MGRAMDLPISYLVIHVVGIMSKCDIATVIPHSHNHSIFDDTIMSYSISTSTHAKGEAWLKWITQPKILYATMSFGIFWLKCFTSEFDMFYNT